MKRRQHFHFPGALRRDAEKADVETGQSLCMTVFPHVWPLEHKHIQELRFPCFETTPVLSRAAYQPLLLLQALKEEMQVAFLISFRLLGAIFIFNCTDCF